MAVTYTSEHTGGKIDNMITKSENTNIAYATCDTAESTNAKVATVSGNPHWSLQDGSMVVVKFTYGVVGNSTLNVNNTGAKEIYRNGTPIATGIISAGDMVMFTYDGTNYNVTTSKPKIDVVESVLVFK